MQWPPFLEQTGFCFWKACFETYVKSKDIDLWQVIKNNNFYYEVEDSEDKLMKETPYEILEDDQKKNLGKNSEAKITLYNALLRKEYERVFMCKTATEVWHTLIITHQGNLQVKNCKIDLLTQEYEKFSISNEETIDSRFIRFNAIVTSLKSLDPDYSSKNHARKFLRALQLKWRANVTAIKKGKDLATRPLDELVGNLKFYEMILENDGVVSKITTKEKVKSLALEAKVTREQTSDDSDSQGGSDEDIDEEEEAEAFNLFGRGSGNRFSNKGGEISKPKGACYNHGIEGHFASECRKAKEKKTFIRGAWSNSKDGDKHQNNATCLMAIDSQEVCLKCDLIPDDWIMDSGCTKHMTGNRRLFTSYKAYDGGHIVFGRNLKGKVISGGNITHVSITITNVEHVSGLAFNLISIGYSQTSKAYIVLNKGTMRIEESLNVTFDESLPEPKTSSSVEDDRIIEPVVQNSVRSPSLEANVSELGCPKNLKEARGHPIEQ
ncbi:retrovirus-related pol polyprotein from transposon TNT 1-94, partial [Tanacetum coccineum]